MPIPDNEIYPIETVVRLKRTNEFGIIKKYTFQHEQKGFLNYLVQVEDRQGLYCWFHDDIDLEHLAQREIVKKSGRTIRPTVSRLLFSYLW